MGGIIELKLPGFAGRKVAVSLPGKCEGAAGQRSGRSQGSVFDEGSSYHDANELMGEGSKICVSFFMSKSLIFSVSGDLNLSLTLEFKLSHGG
jgi:hypothetical protein